LKDAGGRGQHRVLPVLRLRDELGDLFDARTGDVAHATAGGLDRTELVG
jgi:hypothetical protein